MTGVRFPAIAVKKLFTLFATASGAHPASCVLENRGFFPRGQSGWLVLLIFHPCVVLRLKMRGGIPPLPQYAFMA